MGGCAVRRGRAGAGALLGVLALLAAACTSVPAAQSHGTTQPKAHKHKPTPPPNHTFPGPYGKEASWVVAENERPGTTAWRITKGASPDINGFANKTYASDGTKVTLYVSTPARSFRVEAFRMGYYQGKGRPPRLAVAVRGGPPESALPANAGRQHGELRPLGADARRSSSPRPSCRVTTCSSSSAAVASRATSRSRSGTRPRMPPTS